MEGATGASTVSALQANAGAQAQAQAPQTNVTDTQQVQQVQQETQTGDLYAQQQQASQQEQQQSDEALQQEANQDYELQAKTLDADDTAELKNFAKQLGLNGKQAQAITSVLDKAQQGFNEDLQGRFNTQVSEWRKAVMNDPEIGGQNFANTKLNIGRVMQRFGNPEVSALLNQSGIGYNPAFVKFINAVGSVLGNDTGYVNGTQATPQRNNRSDALRSIYNNSPNLNF